MTLSPAQAQSQSEQLARLLHVDSGAYTTAQLAQMKAIIEGVDNTAERELLLSAIIGNGNAPTGAGTEKQQLARNLGVNASEYSTDQLALLKSILEDDSSEYDHPDEFARSDGMTGPVPPLGEVQLAADLGVDPNAYSLSELVFMKFDAE
ncbi:hypothetical protein [Oceanibium sediminis]|uniref:hypothetical protein n=1 Tax=Oceanibium sediminis TaxID=2026339 RepID=UPI0013008907|nr:hypothetical protein [Oceanibium sediminis]